MPGLCVCGLRTDGDAAAMVDPLRVQAVDRRDRQRRDLPAPVGAARRTGHHFDVIVLALARFNPIYQRLSTHVRGRGCRGVGCQCARAALPLPLPLLTRPPPPFSLTLSLSLSLSLSFSLCIGLECYLVVSPHGASDFDIPMHSPAHSGTHTWRRIGAASPAVDTPQGERRREQTGPLG